MPDFRKLYFNNDSSVAKGPFYIKYGVPLLLTVLVTIIKIEFINYVGYQTPFLLYFGIVIIASRYFGRGPAIGVTLLSGVLANVFFIVPYNAFSPNPEAIAQLLLFVIECGLLIVLSNALTKAFTLNSEKDLRFRALVEQSSEGIITINAGGHITYCSPSVQKIIGYTDEEFINLPSWQLLHPNEALEIKEQFYRFAAHPGKHITMQHRMKHKNGHWIWIESKMTNLLGERPINAIIANFTDINSRITDDKIREDFISIASHELKTPLTSLKAYTQVLQSRFKDGTDQTSLSIINKIEMQVSKVIQMVTNLLDVTSLQQKKLVLNVRPFEFNMLVTEIVDSLQQTTKKHVISTNLNDNASVLGDRERISQVIINLISNAIKYSPDADEINVSSQVEGDKIKVMVHDKGIGIPQKEIDKIFARFYRADGESRKNFQGLGLGLFICAQIIELHNGKIGVESTENQGSTFWFSLPLKSQ
ncbi:PAS domain S-box-containing protein [Mucilaginibacter gracilis]|uniref:histidine kinase n=1 Tax=Mucilaginibacter gracilis TaxID=423350 RepID=A0A495IYU4_9SPHI|nr:ATP-binding protein [Mucilaginibacter gracilis]RKR81742.1 PAS domain S-box-containing protein [Mucilaginibacter gracilis]